MRQRTRKWIEIFLPIITLFKIGLFYYLINISLEQSFIPLVSLLYIGIFYYLWKRSSSNYKKGYLVGISIMMSFLMFMDVIYYRFFNKLTSISLIGQAGQLGAVKESISMLLDPTVYLLFIDIPFVFYFLSQKREIKTKSSKWKSRVVFLGGLLLILGVVINPLNSDYIKVFQSQEFFTYHFYDLYEAVAGDNEAEAVAIEDIVDKNESKGKALFGVGEGRNLIVIQVEALQNIFINQFYEGQEITPNLNKLIKGDTLYFNHYYQQVGKGNTSDAEFVTQNSLYAMVDKHVYTDYQNNYFYGLPWVLKEKGYKTMVFHGYKGDFWNREKAYPHQGFDTFISQKDYKINHPIGFGLNDKEFFEQSLPYLKDSPKPFYSFLITLSSHHPYQIPKEDQGIKLKKEHKGTLLGDYLQAIHYTDQAIGEFIEMLKENGLYDNTMIAIYGDHHGLYVGDEKVSSVMDQYLGRHYDFDDMMNIPLLIHIPGQPIHQTIERTGGQIDFFPTMMNLMGIDKKNLLVFGQDLVNAKSGFVASQAYLLSGSYIDDEIVFEMSRDWVFDHSRAWNKKTRKSVDIQNSKENYERANKEIKQSYYILENNLLKETMKKMVDIEKKQK